MKDTSILTNNGVNVQASLELFGDMEMYDETLGDFLDMSDEKITTLEQYKNANDMPNYAIAVHALKSDARYLGFTTLADLAYESEMKSKAGDSVFVAENHANILQEAKRVINLSQQYMGRELTQVIPEGAGETTPVMESAPVEQTMPQPEMVAQPVMETAVVQEAAPVMESAPVEQTMVQPEMVAQPVMETAVVQEVDPVMESVPVEQTMVQPEMVVQPVMETAVVQEAAPVMESATVEQTIVQPEMVVQPVMETAVVQEMAPVMENVPVEQTMVQPEMVVQPVMETAVVQEMAPVMENVPVEQTMVQPESVQSPGFTSAPASDNISANSIQFFPADNYDNDPMNQALFMQQQKENSAPQVGAVKKGIILVVDDSPLVSNFVKKIFSSNYDVLIASDGQKAIDIINDENVRKQIKTCLLDLNMPNVSGFDVMDYFKEKGFFVRTPVAIISGAEDNESLDKAKGYPIVDVLPKPFNERDVQRVVEKCLAVYF